MTKVIIIGTGGHAKVIIDILNEMKNVSIVGLTSIDLQKGDIFCGYTVLGTDDIIEQLSLENKFDVLAMGVGGFKDNNLRTKLFNNFKSKGYRFCNVIHPHSTISQTSKIGEGTIVFPGVIINTSVTIGDNCIIATGTCIDHETIIENNVLLSAGTIVGANVKIGENSLIALGSKIISSIVIGKNALVAAGGVVVNDIPDNSRVFGIPAKPKL